MLFDSASYESEAANSPIKATQQESNEEVLCLTRTRKGTMQSKMVFDKNNDMKMKLRSKETLRKTGKKNRSGF